MYTKLEHRVQWMGQLVCFLFHFHSITVQLNRNWTKMEQKLNRYETGIGNGTEIQMKLRTDNKCSLLSLGYFACYMIVYKLRAPNRASIVRPQFPFHFCSISVQFPFNICSIFCSISVQFLFNFCSISVQILFNWTGMEWKLKKSRWVDPIAFFSAPTVRRFQRLITA